MLRFYRNLALRLPDLLWKSAGLLDKIIGIISLCLSVFGVTAWWPFSPLWGVVPIVLFFVYGLMKANYKAFQEIQADKEALEKQVATEERRAGLKAALVAALKEGQNLHDNDPSKEEAEDWVTRVYTLINAAYSKSDAEFFVLESGFWASSVPNDSPPKRWIRHRLERLQGLLQEVDSLNSIPPDFNGWDWIDPIS